jgi:hypothetical protein
MSTINVDVVSPQSGNNVEVNGVEIRGYNQAIKIGPGSGDNLGIFSLAIGTLALSASTGQSNTAIGFLAGANQTTGFGNTALGTSSLKELLNTSNNTALGYSSLMQSKPNGIGANTAIGSETLVASTTGNENTAIGFSAGSLITTGDNNTCIGRGSQPSIGTVSHEVTIGDTRITALRCAVTSITSLSDARDKKEVVELSAGLDFVKKLKPVEFVWDERDEKGKHDIKDFGFIAQDLKKSQEDAKLADTLKLVYEENPEKLEASYGKLIPILVKAIQDLSAKVEALEAKKK